MIGELAFWGVLLWCGMMAFRYWGNNVAPRNWETTQRDTDESQRHAPYRNRDVSFLEKDWR